MQCAYFVVLTTYQLYVADVYANYLIDNYKNVKIRVFLVGIEEFDTTNLNYEVIKIPDLNQSKLKRFIQRLVWAGRFFFVTPIYKYFCSIKNCNLFVFNDNEPITNKLMRMVKRNKTNKVTIIEEGIGMYEKTSLSNGKLSRKQKLRLGITWLLGSPMQFKALGENELIDNAIVGDKELFKTLEKSRGKIVVTQNKTALLKDADGFLVKAGIKSVIDYKSDVLYLGQPFAENGELAEGEIDYIETLASGVEHFLIKPHPRDKVGKYKKIVENNSNISVVADDLCTIPLECLIGALKVTVLITLVSSAGVNISKNSPTIQCVFTYKMRESQDVLKQIDNGYIQINEELFKSRYSNIFVPNSINEYRNIISTAQAKEYFNNAERSYSEKYCEMDSLFNR